MYTDIPSSHGGTGFSCSFLTPPKDATPKETLAYIRGVLLDTGSSHGELFEAVHLLSDLFFTIGNIAPSHDLVPEKNQDIRLDSGVAISPIAAAMCTVEYNRTTQLIRGVKAAIDTRLSENDSKTVHILYAGTGPYATLLFTLLQLYADHEVQCTLLDIHDRSLQSVRAIATALDLTPYIRDILQCDATHYRHDPEDPFQILITETMAYALYKEPHVSIVLNLAPQMDEKGILIPERITIGGTLAHKKHVREQRHLHVENPDSFPHIPLGTIFTLDKMLACEHAHALDYARKDIPIALPAAEFTAPESIDEDYDLYYFTHIDVYGGHRINAFQSSLTHPVRAFEDQPLEAGEHVLFYYRLGSMPQIEAMRHAPLSPVSSKSISASMMQAHPFHTTQESQS